MTNLTQVYLSSAIAMIVLSGIIIGLLIAYARLFGEYEKLTKKEAGEEKKLDDKTSKIIEKAQKDYAKIIIEANKKAGQILKDAVLIKKTSNKQLEKALEEFELQQENAINQAAKEVLDRYKIKLDEVSTKDIDTIGNVSKDIEKYTSSQVEEYKNIIEEETLSSQKALEKRIEDEYQKVEEELKTYRNDKLKNIDENILKIVEDVVRVTLEKSINIQGSEDTVIEALENAKKEGKLN